MVAFSVSLILTFIQTVLSGSSEKTCDDVLRWCQDSNNFLAKNCPYDKTAPDFDRNTCQNLYNTIGQNDCIVRAFRSGSSVDPCADVQLPYGQYNDHTLNVLEATVACENFSYAQMVCVEEFSKLDPKWEDIDRAQRCIFSAAEQPDFKADTDAQTCLKLAGQNDGLLHLVADKPGVASHTSSFMTTATFLTGASLTIKIRDDNFCFDSPNQDGETVHLWACDETQSNQLWTFTPSGQIKLYGTELCLEGASTGWVHVRKCDTNESYQTWTFEPESWTADSTSGLFKLKRYNYCLDVPSPHQDGAKVQMWSCMPSSANQIVSLRKTTPAPSSPPTAPKPTTPKPTPEPTSATPSQCVEVWGQCGGVSDDQTMQTWSKPCCAATTCNKQSVWYSQCLPNATEAAQGTHNNRRMMSTAGSVEGAVPTARPTQSDETFDDQCVELWGQCGGVITGEGGDRWWSKPCCFGYECRNTEPWYSQCESIATEASQGHNNRRTMSTAGSVEGAVPTARPTLNGETFHVQCGCICPGDACFTLYRCSWSDHQKELKRCSTRPIPGVPTARPTLAGQTRDEPTARPTLSGMVLKPAEPTARPTHAHDGLLTAVCGSICPGDERMGLYRCTQGERQRQLAQCPKASTDAPAEPTARPTHNADGFKGSVCGAICPGDDRMGVYPCTQGERQRQLAQCLTTMTKYCVESGKIWRKEGGCRDCTEKDRVATLKDGVTPKYPQCLPEGEDNKNPSILMAAGGRAEETTCLDVLEWCEDKNNFLTKNCDSTAKDFDPATCQNLYNVIGQSDCVVRAFRSAPSTADPCSTAQLPFGDYDDQTLDTMQSMVACENFSYAQMVCVDEFSVKNPSDTDFDRAFRCIFAEARQAEFKADKDAQECLKFENEMFSGDRKP